MKPNSEKPTPKISSFSFNAITNEEVFECINSLLWPNSQIPTKNVLLKDYLHILVKDAFKETAKPVLSPDIIFAKFNLDEFKEWVERGQFDDSLKHQNNQEVVSLTFSVEQLQVAISAYAHSRFMPTGPQYMGMPNSNPTYNNSFQSGYQPTYQRQNGFLQCATLHAYLEMLCVNSSLDEYIYKYQRNGAFMLCSKFKPYEFYQWVASQS